MNKDEVYKYFKFNIIINLTGWLFMQIVNVFKENGKTLEQLIEKLLIDYCLEVGSFKK